MFFHHLKNFSPYSGHIYDGMRVPLIKKKDSYIEKSDSRFDLLNRLGYFPFKELLRNDQPYFISDIELFEFLQTNTDHLENYEVSFFMDWNFQAKENFVELFINGYGLGIKEFNSNIVQSNTLPHEQKISYLRNFCLFCLDFLYFDGELDKGLFYNLGYLQANLYRGFVEINNLESAQPGGSPGLRFHHNGYGKNLGNINNENITEEQSSVKVKSEVKPSEFIDFDPFESTDDVTDSEVVATERIELLCNLEEIKSLWLILTAPLVTKNGKEEAIFDTDQLSKFLGASFSSGAFPDAFTPYDKDLNKRTSKGDMRQVLNALMYATYNVNHEYNRKVTQTEYVGILKRHFTVFSGSEPMSIKNTMSTNNPKGLEIIKNSKLVNPYVEELLNILKKHKLLH